MPPKHFIALALFTALLLTPVPASATDPLQSFPNCTLQPADWSDGDSFPVKFPDGRTFTIRLYGVDCMEMHIENDESNARRLRDQRRWFGIADIIVAKSIGEEAKVTLAKILTEPFTVHTAFADGRGDPRYKRVYGFVTTADGKDLAELLVQKGLARAFGVVRSHPTGTSAAEWREQLHDFELLAAKNDAGAWAHTDWDRLHDERREARREEAELQAAMSKPPALAEGESINPNTAARDELIALPGIGETMALRIIEHRPYQSPDDLLAVPGIGPKTLDSLKPFLTFE
ncbi:MAG: helix-hairpin-helix domain-containing protein [Verrucomicrobiota bacterium]